MCNDSTKAPKSARKKMVLCCCGQNKGFGTPKKASTTKNNPSHDNSTNISDLKDILDSLNFSFLL